MEAAFPSIGKQRRSQIRASKSKDNREPSTRLAESESPEKPLNKSQLEEDLMPTIDASKSRAEPEINSKTTGQRAGIGKTGESKS